MIQDALDERAFSDEAHHAHFDELEQPRADLGAVSASLGCATVLPGSNLAFSLLQSLAAGLRWIKPVPVTTHLYGPEPLHH
jgi:hypothetical protein